MPAHLIADSESGFGQNWPTPRAIDGRSATSNTTDGCLLRRMETGFENLAEKVQIVERRIFPAPTVQDAKNNGAPSQMERNTKPLNAEIGGALNPNWVEWLMGWPIEWTDLKPLETDKFQQWRQQHSGF